MAIYKEDIAEFIWRNGEIIPWKEALIHVNAVGHASVAGIFEGIKAYWNPEKNQLYVFRLRDHMKRFLFSIRMVRYGFEYSLEQLEQAVVDLLRANKYKQHVYIRPYVFQKGMVRELLQPQPGKATELVIDSWPFEAYQSMEKALHVCVSSWIRISDHIMPPRLKCFSNYHNGRLAAMEATINGYDWPILLDDGGKVTEGPGACLLLVREGKVIAPPVTSGILESITRDTVACLCRNTLGIEFIERPVDRTELYVAEEVFFVGTGWEIMPVASVDRIPVGDGHIGPITRKIAETYRTVVLGKDPAYAHWLHPVWE
jgi:branched-chain amino acid aminotransferase